MKIAEHAGRSSALNRYFHKRVHLVLAMIAGQLLFACSKLASARTWRSTTDFLC
jgi:hypothetical protein